MPEISTQTSVGTYCGKKPTASKPAGTPNFCYRKGLRVGFVGGINKGIEQQAKKGVVISAITKTKHEKELEKEKTKTKMAKAIGRQQLAKDIKEKGLLALKREIHVNTLNMGELKSVFTRLGAGHKPQGYGHWTQQQLRDWLIQHGWSP